jgi:hypothetical protein
MRLAGLCSLASFPFKTTRAEEYLLVAGFSAMLSDLGTLRELQRVVDSEVSVWFWLNYAGRTAHFKRLELKQDSI